MRTFFETAGGKQPFPAHRVFTPIGKKVPLNCRGSAPLQPGACCLPIEDK
jgi:hypothetical protein